MHRVQENIVMIFSCLQFCNLTNVALVFLFWIDQEKTSCPLDIYS